MSDSTCVQYSLSEQPGRKLLGCLLACSPRFQLVGRGENANDTYACSYGFQAVTEVNALFTYVYVRPFET